MFLKIWQLLKKNTCVRVSVFQNSPTQVISCVICEIVKNIFFNRTSWVAASVFDRILRWWWHVQECLKNGKQMLTWKIANVYFILISMKTKKIVILDFNIEVKTNWSNPGSRTPVRTGWLLFLAIYGQSKEAATGGVLEFS